MSMDSFKYVDTDTGNAFELKNVLFNGGPTSLPNVTNIYGMTYSPSAMWFDSVGGPGYDPRYHDNNKWADCG
jgi:hypothetical protein